MSAEPAGGAQPSQKFELQKVYIKDLSLETPNSPQVFTGKWKPELQMEIQSNAKPMAENVYEVELTLTLTAKDDDKIGYLIELTQCGAFTLSGFERAQLGPMLGAFCPNMLFPYAREAVDSLLTRAGFPPLHLAPINFDALYQQHAKQQKTQDDSAAATPPQTPRH